MLALVLILISYPVVSAAISRNLAYSYLYKAESKVDALNNLNISASRITDLVNEARILFDLEKYELSVNYSAEAIKLADLAQNTSTLLESNDILLLTGSGLGINLTFEEKLQSSSEREFLRENFVKAHTMAKELSINLQDKLKEKTRTYSSILAELNAQAFALNIASKRISTALEWSNYLYENIDAKQLIPLQSEVTAINKSLSCMRDAKNQIAKLRPWIQTPMLDNLFDEQVAHFELGDYDEVQELCVEIRQLSAEAERAYREILALNKKILDAEKKMDVEEPRRIVVLAKQKLDQNQIEQAQLLTEESATLLEQQIADDMLFNVISKSELSFNLGNFLKKHWFALMIICLTLSTVVALSYHNVTMWNNKRRYNNLTKNEKILKDMMKKAQTDYFVNKKLTKEDYDSKMDSCQSKLITLREELSTFETKERPEPKTKKRSWIKRKCMTFLKSVLIQILKYEDDEKKGLN